MTKILACGDIHGDLTLASRLAEKAEKENVDLVVICGDISLGETNYHGIISQFKNKGKEVAIIPGNHESEATIDFLSTLYGIKNLHNSTLIKDNIAFFGFGGANIGLFQFSEDQIRDSLIKLNSKIESYNPKTKIMVTHVHPSGTKMEKLTQFFPGSSGLREAIEKIQPDILLCSHVHEAEGLEEQIGKTRIINVGRNGKILEF